MSEPVRTQGNAALADAMQRIAEMDLPRIEASPYELRVWWIPQIGTGVEPFYVPVEGVNEAKKVLNMLADYDAYQFRFNIKPDYTNQGGLEVKDGDDDWREWETADGDDIQALLLDDLAQEVAQ